MPTGADLAVSRDTDFFHVGDHLDPREPQLLARVREYCDTQVAPVANEYWERAEFPLPLVPGYRELGVAGGALPATAARGCPRWPRAWWRPSWPAATAASPPSTPCTPGWP